MFRVEKSGSCIITDSAEVCRLPWTLELVDAQIRRHMVHIDRNLYMQNIKIPSNTLNIVERDCGEMGWMFQDWRLVDSSWIIIQWSCCSTVLAYLRVQYLQGQNFWCWPRKLVQKITSSVPICMFKNNCCLYSRSS